MDHRMGPDFKADKDQGDDGKDHLQAFGALLTWTEWPAAPLRRGTRAKAPDPRENGEVDERADSGQRQHGNTDGVLMKAAGRGVNAARRSQRRKTDGDADAADGENSGANALQEGDDETCAAQTA